MPFVRITTNAATTEEHKQEVLKELSQLTAEITGKPESYVMASLSTHQTMSFAGTTDSCMFVEFKSLGLEKEKCAELSAALCSFLEKRFHLQSDRIYIEFSAPERSMFGWNGGTF